MNDDIDFYKEAINPNDSIAINTMANAEDDM
jgi:hypothetical protein